MRDLTMERFFAPQKSLSDNYYVIAFTDNDIFEDSSDFCFRSSYHVLGARLLGLSYPDFLLYCVKNYNAKLTGKRGYCHVAFKSISDCQKLCRILDVEFKKFLKATELV